MGKVDEIIYSDLFKRIYSRDVLKILDTSIPIQKSHKSSNVSNEMRRFEKSSYMIRSNEGDYVRSSMEEIDKQEKPAYTSRPSKTNDVPYSMEEIIDALLFVDSDLSTEKIFCLLTLAKQNFINRINKKPSSFSLNSLEEHTYTNEAQKYLDYGRISFMNVRPMGSTDSSSLTQSSRRRPSQSSQRSSISIEDSEAPFNDKLEYLVDYILEVLLVIYPEKLRMVLELEQCSPMYMKLLSTPKNLSFMETILGNRLRLKSLESIPEQGLYRRKYSKNDVSNMTEVDKSARCASKTSDYSYIKKYSNRLIHDPSEIPAHSTSNGVTNSPLCYLKNVLESNSLKFKEKLKDTLVGFVTNNVQAQARFYRTPSGRGFERGPTSNSGLLQTILLKVDNEPQERIKLSKINFSKNSESSKRRLSEMNTGTISKKGQYEIGHENRTDSGQMRRRSKNIFLEVRNDKDTKHRLDRSPSIVNPIR